MKTLRKIQSRKVSLFKIKNRRGFAAILAGHLTEGKSPQEAFLRMAKAVKRSGYQLAGSAPRSR